MTRTCCACIYTACALKVCFFCECSGFSHFFLEGCVKTISSGDKSVVMSERAEKPKLNSWMTMGIK